MANKKKKKARAQVKKLGTSPKAFVDKAPKLWLAGLGALERAQKTGGEEFDKLVARGAAAQAKAGHKLEKALGKAAGVVQEALDTASQNGSAIEEQAERLAAQVAERIPIARRAEFEALTARVQDLWERLEGEVNGTHAVEKEIGAAFQIVAHESGWAVEKEGASRATSTHPTKKEALRAGRALAREHAPSRLVVFKTDGTVQEEVTY